MRCLRGNCEPKTLKSYKDKVLCPICYFNKSMNPTYKEFEALLLKNEKNVVVFSSEKKSFILAIFFLSPQVILLRRCTFTKLLIFRATNARKVNCGDVYSADQFSLGGICKQE